jgi:transposase
MVRTRDARREAEAVRLAVDEGMTAVAIAGTLGADERTVRRWLDAGGVILRPGPRPSRPRPVRRPLGSGDAGVLRAAWDAVPPPARRTAGHDLASQEGRVFTAALEAHRRAGVSCAELSRALGVSAQYIRRISTRDGEGSE